MKFYYYLWEDNIQSSNNNKCFKMRIDYILFIQKIVFISPKNPTNRYKIFKGFLDRIYSFASY